MKNKLLKAVNIFGNVIAAFLIGYSYLTIFLTVFQAYSWIGQPFPGFIFAAEGGVAASSMPYWEGAKNGLQFPLVVKEINGRNAFDNYYEFFEKTVKSVPIGTPIKYRIYMGMGKGEKDFEIKTMRFEVRDFIYIYLFYAILCLSLITCGMIAYLSLPHTPMGWGVLLFCVGFNGAMMSAAGGLFLLSGFFRFIRPFDPLARIFIYSFTMTGVSAGAYVYHLFWVIFKEPKFFKDNPLRYSYLYLISILMVAIGFYGIMIKQYDLYSIVWLYVQCSYLLPSIIVGLIITLRVRYTSTDPNMRQRARILLMGILITTVSSFTAYAASALGMPFSFSIGFLPSLTLVFAIAYAIMSSNLFGVDEFVRKTIQYFGTTVITGIIYSIIFYLLYLNLSRFEFYNSQAYVLISIVLMIMAFIRIKRYVQRIIDKAFFKTKVDYEKVMEQVEQRLTVVTNKNQIYEAIRDVAVENLFLSDVDILLAHPDGSYKSIEKGAELKSEDDLLIAFKEKHGLLSKSELLNDPKFQNVRYRCLAKLAYLEAIFLLPIMFQDEMLGIMALGERRSGDITFNLQDMEVLHHLAVQSATAFENARLYEEAEEAKKEIEKMNEILEEKVRIRTAELEARAKDLEEQNAHIIFITHNKSAFLASMSHELRTPLTGILGFSDMAVEGVYGQINPVAKDVLKDLAFNGRELLQLINDILDLSKIEAGKMELKMEDFSPLDAVEQSVGTWIREAEGKGIEIEIDHARNLPLGWGEGKRVKQMLDTLLRNAVRWSQTKRITIRVTCAPEHQGTCLAGRQASAPEKKVLLFEVEDYGVGIESYRMPKLFVEHEYPQILDLQYYKNVGVGLALAKKWAELHGGEMRAESAEGKGSKFSFAIPLKEGVALEEAGQIERAVHSPHEKLRQKIKMEEVSHQYKDLAGKRILSIEDNEANQKILSDYLRSHDCIVIEAMDGEDGLNKALSLKPDLIITDIQLPKLNGLEIIKRIRAAEDQGIRDVPILIASSFAMLTDIDKGIASGGNAYLAKPYNFQEIMQAVKKYLLK